jgi:phage baseplate assembly protein W|tara:strand:- start:1658 stop:2059 length:402 start_codon:yes stop_codon:yes gene_type:complete
VPVQRASKAFKDISMSFKVSPLTFDLIANKNETAIARSIRNLILTAPGERPFNPELGSQVSRLLFEPLDDITTNALKEEIRNTINNFEPRVSLRQVFVQPNFSVGSYEISIRYDIVGVEASPQQLSFALQQTR